MKIEMGDGYSEYAAMEREREREREFAVDLVCHSPLSVLICLSCLVDSLPMTCFQSSQVDMEMRIQG